MAEEVLLAEDGKCVGVSVDSVLIIGLLMIPLDFYLFHTKMDYIFFHHFSNSCAFSTSITFSISI